MTRLTHRQAADLMCVSSATLYDWRCRGRRDSSGKDDHGPQWHAFPNGRFWYYEAADVEDYMEKHSITMTRTLTKEELTR